MKPLLLILLYFVSVDVNYSDSYQKDAWKCLDNSYKTLLTDPKQSAAYSMQAYDIDNGFCIDCLYFVDVGTCLYALWEF